MIKVQDAFSTPTPPKKKVKGSQMTLGRPTPSLTLALYLTVQCSVICWMEQLSLVYILS